jgi:peptide/nickel transport system substrate-binding protein
VEVTRIVTEEQLIRPTLEVTRLVTELVEVTPTTPATNGRKELVVCMPAEPTTLFLYGADSPARRAIFHAIYENLFTSLDYQFQPQGLEKLPSFQDGDVSIASVEVRAGDRVVDASGDVVALREGMHVVNAGGASVAFDGQPVTMSQLTVEFTFRPLAWEDGTPVTAADSVLSYDIAASALAPGSKLAVERTATYEATGERTVRWTGIPGWLDSRALLPLWPPLPRHILGDMTTDELLASELSQRRPLAYGPFRIDEWVAGEELRLVRNEHYYRLDEGLPRLDAVTFRFVPNRDALMAQLVAGDCDVVTRDGAYAGQIALLQAAEEQGLVVPYFTPDIVFEHLDFGVEPANPPAPPFPRWLAEPETRRALAMCINRQAMVDSLLGGRSEVMHAYVPNDHPLAPADLRRYPYDPAAAAALLDSLGYLDNDGDGVREDPATMTPFELNLLVNDAGDLRPLVGQMIRDDLVQCGVAVDIERLPAVDFFADGPVGPVFGRDFDLALFPWLADFEPSCHLFVTEQIQGPPNLFPNGWRGLNASGWSDSDFDNACERALAALPGQPDYQESHQQALHIFAEELPILPLFAHLRIAATNPLLLYFRPNTSQPSELWNLFEMDLAE